jgi:serine/threonine protein phosphatase PrpC
MVKKNPYIDTKLSGSTGVMVLVKDNMVHCANVGDSRAILIRKSNYIVELSTDQKPSDPSEKQRILANGGKVHPCRSKPRSPQCPAASSLDRRECGTRLLKCQAS